MSALPGEPADVTRLRWLRAAMVCVFVLLWFGSAWVSDDAYITFRSVHALFEGYGPRWNVLERVQAYTHPLWLFLLVVLRELGVGNLFLGVLFLSLAFSGLTVALLLSQARDWVSVVAVTALLCASKSFVEFSSSGLENPLSHLLVLLFFLFGLGMGPIDARWRGAVLGLLVTALALCRVDLLAIVAPLVAWALYRARAPTRWGWLAGLIPLAVWEAWSLLYYGDIVPNTACAKMVREISVRARLDQAESYYLESLGMDYVTIPVIGLAIVLGIHRGGAQRFAAFGIALYVLYVAWIPGDFMAGRMQSTPYLLSIAILMTLWSGRRRYLAAMAALALCGAVLNPKGPLPPSRVADQNFKGLVDLADERAFYFDASHLDVRWEEGRPVVGQPSNWSLPLPWSGGTPPIVVDFGGMSPYLAGMSHHYIDEMALSDPLLSRLPGAAPGFLDRPGHLARRVPPGYTQSLITGENVIADPAIAALWDDVRIATRAPLGDPRRWKAIWGTVMCGHAHREGLSHLAR